MDLTPVESLAKRNKNYFKTIHPAFRKPIAKLDFVAPKFGSPGFKPTGVKTTRAKLPDLGTLFNPEGGPGDIEGNPDAPAMAVSVGEMIGMIGTMGLSAPSVLGNPIGSLSSISNLSEAAQWGVESVFGIASAMSPLGAMTTGLMGLSSAISGLLGSLGISIGEDPAASLGLESGLGVAGLDAAIAASVANLGPESGGQGLGGGGNVGGGGDPGEGPPGAAGGGPH